MLTIATILCPTDFSPTSRAAVDHAADLALHFEAELVLVHVVTPSVFPSIYGLAHTMVEEHARKVADESLEELARELTGRGIACRTVREEGVPAVRIVELAGQQQVDLVVLATHGWTGVAHALLGSTAERVVRRCPCPVLTFKAPAGK